MKIKYVHHSGFIVEADTWALVIDCCGLTKESPELRACTDKCLYVLASHVHSDHFDPSIMSFHGVQTKWILSSDIRKKVSPHGDICFLAKGDLYHDETAVMHILYIHFPALIIGELSRKRVLMFHVKH